MRFYTPIRYSLPWLFHMWKQGLGASETGCSVGWYNRLMRG
jgi:hypothetical protein